MRTVYFLVPVLLVLCGSEAQSEAPSIDCSGAYTIQCKPFDAGSPSVEYFASHEMAVFRISGRFALYGHDFAGEILYSPNADGWLRIRDPYGWGEGVVTHVEKSDVARIIDRWQRFQASLAATDFAAIRKTREGIPPCMDGGTVQIDAADEHATRHVVLDDCLVRGLEDFYFAVSAQMYKLVPLCAGLEQMPTPLCLRLAGNKDDAIQVARTLTRFEQTDCKNADQLRGYLDDNIDVRGGGGA